ncbi:protein of unknown function [uncultured Sphingopyxis sp.]|uniref:Uncharacterized protein n=1 Tax=uncultured Sphingopyxis sp. TaxID=310581 RepID=A0A1Y5PQZ7_9SPHN|nr:protein of unknown function [uncultured Sphingopyxis sp.]
MITGSQRPTDSDRIQSSDGSRTLALPADFGLAGLRPRAIAVVSPASPCDNNCLKTGHWEPRFLFPETRRRLGGRRAGASSPAPPACRRARNPTFGNAAMTRVAAGAKSRSRTETPGSAIRRGCRPERAATGRPSSRYPCFGQKRGKMHKVPVLLPSNIALANRTAHAYSVAPPSARGRRVMMEKKNEPRRIVRQRRRRARDEQGRRQEDRRGRLRRDRGRRCQG